MGGSGGAHPGGAWATLQPGAVEGTDVVLAELTQADPQLTALLRP
ncbi:MAG: hypothetical protein ABIV05_06650 [Actinomycetota bacterium]